VRSRDDLGDIGQQRDAIRNGGSPAGWLPEQRCSHVTEVRSGSGNRGGAFLDEPRCAPVDRRSGEDQKEDGLWGSMVR
jgi:hypothetical protein